MIVNKITIINDNYGQHGEDISTLERRKLRLSVKSNAEAKEI